MCLYRRIIEIPINKKCHVIWKRYNPNKNNQINIYIYIYIYIYMEDN